MEMKSAHFTCYGKAEINLHKPESMLYALRLSLAMAMFVVACSAFAPCTTQWQRPRCRLVSPSPSAGLPRRPIAKGRTGITRADASLSPAANAGLISSSVAILWGYHVHLFRKEARSDATTWRRYQMDARAAWARHVRETEGWLYAIQALRNAMTAQSFLASTVLGLLTLIAGRMWDLLRAAAGRWERRRLTAQLASISLTMLFSAYQFLQGVRLMTHVGFMFPVRDAALVDGLMRRTENCQWKGLRWMYVSVAPIAWVVGGSRAFFAASCLLTQFFRSIDKKPEGLLPNVM